MRFHAILLEYIFRQHMKKCTRKFELYFVEIKLSDPLSGQFIFIRISILYWYRVSQVSGPPKVAKHLNEYGKF